MATVTISEIGTTEVTIPVSSTSDIIIQTISANLPDEITPDPNAPIDHSDLLDLGADDHPQYLNTARGDARYAALSHEEDLTLHYTQASISIGPDQIIGSDGTLYTAAEQTKLSGIEAGAEVNNISDVNASDLISGSNNTLHYHNTDRNRANHTGTQGLDTVVTANLLNSPSTNLDLQELVDLSISPGITDPNFTVTCGTTGTLTISTADFLIRATSDGTGAIYSAYIGGSVALTAADETTTYLYIDYNTGTPAWATTTDPTTINMSDKIAAAIISRYGTSSYVFIVGRDNVDANAKFRKKSFYSDNFTKASGGIVSNPSGLQIAVTAGNYWFGLSEINHLALSGGGVFKYYYYTGSSWAVNATATVINATQYNNTASGLTALTSKYYCNHWIYATFGNTNTEYSVIHGQAQFKSLAEAEIESPPTLLPDHVGSLGYLVGVVTISEDTGTIVDIRHLSDNASLIDESIKLVPNNSPASNATGIPGQTAYDGTYFYICYDTNSWGRITFTTGY